MFALQFITSASPRVSSSLNLSDLFRSGLGAALLPVDAELFGRPPKVTLPAGAAHALVVLTRLRLVPSFLRKNAGFLSRRFYDVLIVFNTEGRNGPAAILGFECYFIDVSNFFRVLPCQTGDLNKLRKVTSFPVGYVQMIRFFFKAVFLLPELKNISAFMRLDDDSCLAAITCNPFSLLSREVVYVHNDVVYDKASVCVGLWDLVKQYVEFFQVPVRRRRALSDAVVRKGPFRGRVRSFYNNFEIVKMSFFRAPEVRHFTDFVDASGGIFLYRWGDAPLRYLTLAIFAREDQIAARSPLWRYRHPCQKVKSQT